MHLADLEQKLRMAQPHLAVLPRSAYTVFATEIHRCASLCASTENESITSRMHITTIQTEMANERQFASACLVYTDSYVYNLGSNIV